MKALVSIIIPVFNRDKFIAATLDSILAQSYSQWECILVDDDSSDNTLSIMKSYSELDNRFKVFRRPAIRKKGANACRNYGLEQSKGELIQWFDSDDLMLEDNLLKKVTALKAKNVDYAVARSYYFKGDPSNIISRNLEYYRFEEFELNHFNYLRQNINWLTYDFMGKRSLVKQLEFNEKLHAFQERNYFTKLTIISKKAVVLDEYLTAVRSHRNSIQGALKNDESRFYKELYDFFFETWLELKDLGPIASVDYLFVRNLRYAMHFKTHPRRLFLLSKNMWSRGDFNSLVWFFIFHLSFQLTGKGYKFRKKVLNGYE